MVDRHRTRHEGWSVRRFCSWRRRDGGERSHSWVKDKLQEAGAVPKSKGRGNSRCGKRQSLARAHRSHAGQFVCSKTGHFHLLLTDTAFPAVPTKLVGV